MTTPADPLELAYQTTTAMNVPPGDFADTVSDVALTLVERSGECRSDGEWVEIARGAVRTSRQARRREIAPEWVGISIVKLDHDLRSVWSEREQPSKRHERLLDEVGTALAQLRRRDPAAVEALTLRYGLGGTDPQSAEQIARERGWSISKTDRVLRKARAFLESAVQL